MQDPAIDVWHHKWIPVYKVDLVEIIAENFAGRFGGNIEVEFYI